MSVPWTASGDSSCWNLPRWVLPQPSTVGSLILYSQLRDYMQPLTRPLGQTLVELLIVDAFSGLHHCNHKPNAALSAGLIRGPWPAKQAEPHAYIQSKGKDFRVQRNKFNDTKGSKQANLEGGILHRTCDPVFTVSQWHGEKGGREGSLLTLDWKNKETRCDGWTSCGSWLEQTYCPEAFLTFREI